MLAVAACTNSRKPELDPGPIVVAPMPIEYSCADQKRLAAAFRTLDGVKPEDAILIRVVIDYHVMRMKLRGTLGLPDPPGCPS